MKAKIEMMREKIKSSIRTIKIMIKYPSFLSVKREGRYYRVNARFAWAGSLVEIMMRPTGSVDLLIDHVRVPLGEIQDQERPPIVVVDKSRVAV